MLPLILAVVGGYLVGDSMKDKAVFAEGGKIDANTFDELKKGDKLTLSYGSGSSEVKLLVKSKNTVGKGKSYESEKITFTNIDNPNGVKYYAYKRGSDYVGFAIGDMAISNVKISKFADGGVMEEGVDLFEDYENIPANVQEVLDRHENAFIDGDYIGLGEALDDLENIGYTFDFYVDGGAYDLRQIGQRGKSEQGNYANGGMMAKGGEVRYKLAGNNFAQQIENGQKFGNLITKVYENQSGNKYPLSFIKETAYTGRIVKNDGSNYLKDYTYSGTLSKFEFLDDKDFIAALKYLNRPSIRKFEEGGIMDAEEISRSNQEMVSSQVKAIKHHADELSNTVTDKTPIEAWVVAKVERSETDLSDVTHYLDGLKYGDGGMMMDEQMEYWDRYVEIYRHNSDIYIEVQGTKEDGTNYSGKLIIGYGSRGNGETYPYLSEIQWEKVPKNSDEIETYVGDNFSYLLKNAKSV